MQELSQSVTKIIKPYIESNSTPFLLFDSAKLLSNYNDFCQFLPSVQIYYALKACSELAVIKQLASLNSCFDVSSIGEMKLLSKLDIDANRGFYTHPCKSATDITQALSYGYNKFVFDNVAELEKLAPFKHKIELCLRIGFANKDAVLDLSQKFGCDADSAIDLIKHAKSLGFKTTALAFHVGSQSLKSDIFCTAIDFCSNLIKELHQVNIANIEILDIGGGFPVEYAHDAPMDYAKFFLPINQELKKIPASIKIIAEPGRYLVASSVTAVASIIGCDKRNGTNCYLLDDGLYGSYSGLLYDKVVYPMSYFPYNRALGLEEPKTASKLFGPSCDSADVIATEVNLPAMQTNDYIIGHMIGAYSIATATDFSLIEKPKFITMTKQMTKQATTQVTKQK